MTNNIKIGLFIVLLIIAVGITSFALKSNSTIKYEVLDGRAYYETFDKWNTPELAINGIDAALDKQSDSYLSRRSESVLELIALSSKLNRLELESYIVLDDKDRIETIYIVDTEDTQGALDELIEHIDEGFISSFNKENNKSLKLEDMTVNQLLEDFDTYSLLLDNTVYPKK